MSSVGLSFANEHSEKVYVAIIWLNQSSGCTNGGWEKKGWYSIEPGDTETVLAFDLRTDNLYYYYYAETESGITWSGPYNSYVPRGRFDLCNSERSGRVVGFQELDIGMYSGYTVRLTPPR
jgi:uncharacterized membrane protein